MKVKELVGIRFKEKPQDTVVESHSLMIRGGYVKQVGNGIFSLFTPAKRIIRDISSQRNRKRLPVKMEIMANVPDRIIYVLLLLLLSW